MITVLLEICWKLQRATLTFLGRFEKLTDRRHRAADRPATMAAAMRASRSTKPELDKQLYLEKYVLTARRRRRVRNHASQTRDQAWRENAPETAKCARGILSRARFPR
jgi:hypothetical protein